MQFDTPTPPEPATVAVATLPKVTGGLRLRPMVPRYQRAAATTDATYCFICGAAVPPWRASCFHHDQRQGRGLPDAVKLVALPPAPGYLPPVSTMGTTVNATMKSNNPPMKSQLPRWPKLSVKPIPDRRSTKSAGSLGL